MKAKAIMTAGIIAIALAVAAAYEAGKYPPPLYPVPPSPPKSADGVLPVARNLVRQTAGRTPLGWVKPGQRVIIFAEDSAWLEPNYYVLKALIQAFKERQVDALFVLPRLKHDWVQEGEGYDTAAFGWSEGVNFINGFSKPDEARAWLKKKNPKLWEKLFAPGANPYNIPKETPGVMPARANPVTDKIKKLITSDPNFAVWDGAEPAFLDQYTKPFDAVYAGTGGRPWLFLRFRKHGPKLYGNFVYSEYRAAMLDQEFPADVWRLVEERMIEPLSFTDKAHYVDPEGSEISWDVDRQMATLWGQGAGSQVGHLFLYPHGSTSLRPSPAFPMLKTWEKPQLPMTVNGVLAGTRSHAGVYPRMEIVIQNTRVKEVRGGGIYGDILRAFLDYPPLNETTWPYYSEKGYWFLYEGAYGTNPKAFLQRASQSSERDHSGVVHWALGTQVLNDAPGDDGRMVKFLQANQAPNSHGFHVHNGLSTHRVHIRGTDRWETIVEKGRIKALDNPETRAVAAKYGDPDELLRETFRYDLPGISSPGDYEKDYAQDPWKFMLKYWTAIENGTYGHLYKKKK